MNEKEKQTFLIAMPEMSCYGKQFPAWELGDNATLSDIRKVLNEISTAIADVAPVVHGEWIKVDEGEYQCTHCCLLVSVDDTPEKCLLYYCPKCGARMDGGENHEAD